ncbi:MAG: DUF2911 domain-containing protein [Ignavibacteriales bacterium]|nr:DUF2911 domain-containing protein [Ignavibacteriales bacterium]
MKIKVTLAAVLSFLILISSFTLAQQNNKPRASLKAGVSQRIGIDTDIKIDYSRPGVKGREIWGKLVPYGMTPGDNYSKGKPYPWRGGANENTTIEFSKNVLVEGSKLPAGKYGVHFIPGEKEWTVIFSKNNSNWGSFTYDEKDDALRVTVNSVKAPFQEWLEYGFDNLEATSTTAYLYWAELKVPFKISVAD